MAESTVTVKVELSDESKALVKELLDTFDAAKVKVRTPWDGFYFQTMQSAVEMPARNEDMDTVLGKALTLRNYAEEILRSAERCKTVAEFDRETDILVAGYDDPEEELWNLVLRIV